MYLARKMKLDPRVIGSLGIQEPLALCEVNEVAVFVAGDIVGLEFNELVKLFGIIAGNPAGLIKRNAVELYRCAVLMQQSILDHLELQFSNATNNFLIPAKLSE